MTRATGTLSYTVWVCVDCLLTRECDRPEETDREPWLELAGVDVSRGLMLECHADGCDSPDYCECDRQDFSSSTCDGCGSSLAGSRHAYTAHEILASVPA